ncbi:MAG: hypothetical protein ABFS46_10580 [Myxococcota bacterium]
MWVLAVGGPLPATASTLFLSDVSSDETPAAALFAELRFEIIGATVLRITLLNRTDESNASFGTGEYAIREIYFNATPNVTALSLTSPASGWSLATNQRGGGEFGRFDYALIGDLGKDVQVAVDPGASLVFELDISGTGPFDMLDFATERSRIPPGSMEMLAQAKFVQGPGDDSAFGAVPEPRVALLVTAGLVAALLRRRPG